MVLESCCRCGQPILPGEPAMQTASVDIDDYGRAVSSPVKAYHLTGRCYEDARAAGSAPALDALRALPESRLDGSPSSRIPTRPLRLAPFGSNTSHEGRRHDMNLGEFIDTYKEAIAQRVVESYPPLYRPSENGSTLPRLLRTPLGAQTDAIRGAALSLEAHRGTTVVGEMGTGKTFIGAAAAHMAGFQRILVLCPPHLVPKWKREVEMTVPGARAAIVESITDLERLRLSVGSGPLFAVMSQRAGQAVLPLAGRRHTAVGNVEGQAGAGRGDGRAVPGPLLPRLHGADHGQGRGAPDRRRPEPQAARLLQLRRTPLAG